MTTRRSHRRRGASFETDVTEYLRDLGLTAERLHLAGRLDEGDVSVASKYGFEVLECKAPGVDGKINLTGWVREAHLEAGHYAAARRLDPLTVNGLVVIKARSKPIREAFVVTTLESYFGS